MNRCLLPPLARSFLTLVIVLTSCLGPHLALAQSTLRQFPPSAKRGTLVVTAPPQVTISDAVERLAPGARIHGSNNLLVLSASLTGQSVPIKYVRDPLGLIQEIWILSPQETQGD